jgi:Protein kinase domain
VIALEPSEPTRAARGRLRLAAAARAAIYHPNLIRAWPVGEGGGRLFVAVERCPHPSLAQLLAAAPPEPTECARILDGAAAGVEALSQRALVARDLMPNRVLLDPEQGCMLMDLGIPPELLREVPLEHDPDLAFRSPEELERKPADLRSSVYSLGAMLFTTLTGLPPGYSARIAEVRPRPSERRPELSPKVDAVVARALARDPAERYANPEALSRAVAAALGADRPSKRVMSDRNGRRGQRLPKQRAASPHRDGGRPATTLRTNDCLMPPRVETQSEPGRAEIPPSPRQAEPRPVSGPALRVATHFAMAAARRCVTTLAVLLAQAGTAARRGDARLRRFARVAVPIAGSTARVAAESARRGAKVVSTLFLRACRLVLSAAWRGAVTAAVAARRVHRTAIRLERSAPSVAQAAEGRIDRFARDGSKLWSRLVGTVTAAAKRAFGSERGRRGRWRGPAAIRSATGRSHRKLLLPAVGAILASALSGIALGRAFEPDEAPSSIGRSGRTVQLPSGWQQARADPGRPPLSSAIAAVPSGESKARFVVGKLSSLAAAERMLEGVQRGRDERTQVRLGALTAWQYAGLRPRPHVVGTGYLVPTTGGAVLAICRAPTNEAAVRLPECERAVTTLVVRGERPRPLSSADRSNEHMIRVIATLRASRSEGRRHLEAAELARGQARAATSLQLSHERAARSLDQIAALENGYSLGDLSAAVHAVGAAYGRLADAAAGHGRSAYGQARQAVVRGEEALRRELARTGDA